MSMSFLWDMWSVAGGLLGTEQSREDAVTGLVDKGVTGLTNMGVPKSVFEFAPSTTEPNLIKSADRFAENIPAHIPKFAKGLIELGMNPVDTTKIVHGLLEGGITNLSDTFYGAVLPDKWHEKYLSWKPESSQGEAMASEVGSAFATQMSTEQGRRDAFQQHPVDWLLAWSLLPKNVIGKIPKKQYEGILSQIDEAFPQPLGSQVINWHGNPYGQKYVEFDFDKIGTGMGVQRQAWGMNISTQKETGLSFASQGVTGGVDDALKAIYRGKLESHLTPVERFIWGEAELGKLPEDVEALAKAKYKGSDNIGEIMSTMMQFERHHENSMAQLYKLDLHDDKVKLMISELKPMTQQPLNVQKLMKKHNSPSTMTGREFYDMLAEEFVEITGGEGARKMASLYLLENGVPGMSYLDDVTKTDWKVTKGLLTQQGETKLSHTVFDNSSHTMLERQGQDILKDKMIAQHALSQEALLKHLESTGVPMPSIATTKADKPLQGFGEISLLSDPSMITPSRHTKTYPVDMYSGRAPGDRLEYKDVEAVLDSIDPDELRFHANVHPSVNPSDSDDVIGIAASKGWTNREYLNDKARRQLELKPNHTGILERQIKMTQQAIDLGYNPYQYGTFQEAMFMINQIRRKEGNNPLHVYGSDDVPREGLLGETVRMMDNPKGFVTPLGGKRKDVPYSAEDALKIMRRRKAYLPGAEGYEAVNQTIALASTPFKNLDEIKKSRGLLEDKKGYSEGDALDMFEHDLERVKDALHKLGGNTEYSNTLVDDVLRSGRITAEDIAYMKYTPAQAKEAEKLILSLKEKARQLNSEQWAKENPELADLTTTHRQLSTEYFESKPNRIVDIGEFKGAIVPKETPEYVEKLLKNAGIQKILRYGSEEERIKLFRKFPELMFAGMAIPTGGLLTMQDDEKGKLSGGLLK